MPISSEEVYPKIKLGVRLDKIKRMTDLYWRNSIIGYYFKTAMDYQDING
jgi:hypothetical protein